MEWLGPLACDPFYKDHSAAPWLWFMRSATLSTLERWSYLCFGRLLESRMSGGSRQREAEASLRQSCAYFPASWMAL